MRQSEHKITMPYLDYKELIRAREERDEMISEIRSCFDTSLHDIDAQEPIRFKTDEAIKILGRKYLSNKYKDCAIL